jgi:hypothetical protein
MNSGRASGLYVPLSTLSADGATQPVPLSIATGLILSKFSSSYAKPK